MSEFNIISEHTRVVESAIGRAINEGWVTDRQLSEFQAINPTLREVDLMTDVEMAIVKMPEKQKVALTASFQEIAGTMLSLGLHQNIIKQP
jgi:hypothetical protein